MVWKVPLFLDLMLNMISTFFFQVKNPGVYIGTRFIFWYSWHIARTTSVVIKSTELSGSGFGARPISNVH